jgi:selenocysteine lyase/cysteine desulfurase
MARQTSIGDGASASSSAARSAAPLRILTTDTEFYSMTRQLNRWAEAGVVKVETVAAEPADTFADRFAAAAEEAAAAGRQYSCMYFSQLTYLTQQCLVPSIPALVRRLRSVVGPDPLVVVDGYHGFMAVPTDLAEVSHDCCYVAGMLKHAGCGANAAFITMPAQLAAQLRPVTTGWLADPSVLAPGSTGVQIGSEVRGRGLGCWSTQFVCREF